MADDVKYTNASPKMATPPVETEVRADVSTEAGHTAALIQHVKLDTGDGTNVQPVSGTVTANQGTAGAAAWKVDGSAVTQPVSAASLPLPSGAATASNQTDGSQKTKLTDNYGFVAEFTPMDEMRVVIPFRVAGSTFVGTTKDTNFWSETIANSGSVAQAGGQITLSTNTTAPNGSAQYQSMRGRYIGASANRFRGQIQLGDVGEADNSRKWGASDGTDGAYFELDGTTLYAVTVKTGTPARVASADWNGSTTVPTITECQTYEIYYTNKSVYFVIGGVLKHTVTAASTTWTDTTNLPVYLKTTNSNSLQTQHQLLVRVSTIVRLGPDQTQPKNYLFAVGQTAGVVLKYGPGVVRGISVNSVTNNAVVTIYDGLTNAGTAIWTSGSMGALTTPFAIPLYDVPFYTGLCLEVKTANAGAQVSYE